MGKWGVLFHVVMAPLHNNGVASISERLRSTHGCEKTLFSCFDDVGDNSFTVFGVTVATSMPKTAVVLKNAVSLGVKPVHKGALNPPLPTVPTHCVMNVSFLPFASH